MSDLMPYLCVGDARAAIDGYAEVLGAEVTVDPIVMPERSDWAPSSGTRPATGGS